MLKKNLLAGTKQIKLYCLVFDKVKCVRKTNYFLFESGKEKVNLSYRCPILLPFSYEEQELILDGHSKTRFAKAY